MRDHELVRDLRRVIRALDGSAGRRIARRNALRDLDTLLRRARRELRRSYPSISKTGKEVRRQMLPVGSRRCPADGAYVPTPGEFAAHIMAKHGGRCFCGYVPAETREVAYRGAQITKSNPPAARRSLLAGHLSRLGEKIKLHLTLAGIAEETADAPHKVTFTINNTR